MGDTLTRCFVSRTVASYDSLGAVRYLINIYMVGVCVNLTYTSLREPTYPPRPMDIAPATSSANPPTTTTLEFPRAERPALRANGTVNPSERPRIASETIRGFTLGRVEAILLEVSVLSVGEGGNVPYGEKSCSSRSCGLQWLCLPPSIGWSACCSLISIPAHTIKFEYEEGLGGSPLMLVSSAAALALQKQST